jgi:hypothetical protein
VSEIRRTSASSSGETTTSMVVEMSPSRRRISARSSAKTVSYVPGAVPAGWYPADQTSPL